MRGNTILAKATQVVSGDIRPTAGSFEPLSFPTAYYSYTLQDQLCVLKLITPVQFSSYTPLHPPPTGYFLNIS
jgi:hypothetical protein